MTKTLGTALLVATMMAAPAHAVVVATGSGTLQTGDATTGTRIFRDGNASSWAPPKAFPGPVTGSTYTYDLLNVAFAPNASQTVYYEIAYQRLSGQAQVHSVAYGGAFTPSLIANNYVGDSGSSSTGNTRTFQVVVGTGGTLNLLFTDVIAGELPAAYSYTVQAFSDANRAENFGAVPEPATWATMIAGFALLGGALRRRHNVLRRSPA